MTRFMYRLLAAVAAVALSIGTASAAPTTILIDNFANPNPASVATSGATSLPSGTSAYGLTPTTYSITFSPGLTGSSVATVGTDGGGTTGSGFELNSSGSNANLTTLNFNFSTAQDMTGLDSINFDFDFLDPGTIGGNSVGNLPVSFTLKDAQGDTVTFNTTLNPNPGSFDVFYSSFSSNINFDLNQVTDLTVKFNTGTLQNGVDFRLNSVSVTGDGGGIFGEPEVPEPASIILFGALAVGGAAFARRKFSRRTATV